MATIREEARDVPVKHTADVCVIGGSCTGVFAAVRAARLGKTVVLVEKTNAFGGVATNGLVCIWHSLHDTVGEKQIIGGLTLEIEERLRKRGTEADVTVRRRLANAPDEIRRMDEYHYVVVNDTIEATQASLVSICRAETLRRSRLVDASGGGAVVDEFLKETARPFGS